MRGLPILLLALLAGCGSQPPRPYPASTASAPSPAPAAPSPGLGTAMPKPPYILKRNGGFYQDDGPGENRPPLAFLDAIPDAEPRIEPLHRFANKPYSVLGRDYVPQTRLAPYKALGMGSWYGKKFHGQKTSSGEIYDMYAMSAAHATLPIPSYARVTNPANGKSVVVRINDRGPFHAGRLIDLSYSAAWKLGYADSGSALVEVESVLPGITAVASSNDHTRTPSAGDAGDPLAELIQFAYPGASGDKPVPAVLAEETDSRGVYLQLGAFGNSENAENLKFRLSRELIDLGNFPNLGEKLHVTLRNGTYRVQLGPWRDQGEARQVAERLQTTYNMSSLVVRSLR